MVLLCLFLQTHSASTYNYSIRMVVIDFLNLGVVGHPYYVSYTIVSVTP